MFRRFFRKTITEADVVRIRRESAFLRDLRDRWISAMEGRQCLVIGSAPGVKVPRTYTYDYCICVNGSPYAAKHAGIDRPDVTIINGNTTSLSSEKSRATVPIWKNLKTSEVLFIETGDRADHARSVLSGVNFQYEIFTTITKAERAAIIGDVCGLELGIGNHEERISNGVFAAVLAIWANAAEVLMCGFSLRGGHNYIEAELPRQHVTGDVTFLDIAKRRGFPVKVASVELHEACGLPLVE